MIRIAAYLLVGITVGIGFAWWQAGGVDDEMGMAALTPAERAPLEQRLSELETSLVLERYERQALADDLAELRASIAADLVEQGADAAEDTGDRRPVLAENSEIRTRIEDRVRDRFPDGVPQSAEERAQFLDNRQIERFVDAGFSAERAQWLMQREEELQMEVLRARYEATQAGAPDADIANLSINGLLREELGDLDYERYLEGRGRPTTINVREVLTNSPAATAGLQAGDEIVAYNGQRVFEMNELNSLTYSAGPGETVAIEVMRDGQPVQVFVESGPIGITGGGRSARRGFGGR